MFERLSDELPLDHQKVLLELNGERNAIIFRSNKIELAAGKRYRVTVEGLETPKGLPLPLHYVVELISLKDEQAGGGGDESGTEKP